jgi:hypothetical protein
VEEAGETYSIPGQVVAIRGDTINVPIVTITPQEPIVTAADPEYAIVGERGCSGDRFAGFSW